ncbi:hypothetical protein CH330_03380 [candidate division WOR-3 bacterium JGI_Cruoil_03_51_56]|uniref:FPG-type domain-containing protein n=1 Tax=candidate division WOR-3 bacterium JGI_Cruoil_03_51_56 TaxID=1973747 RepID=A0A235BTA6_UNCW3|nr:MAG: hypothetical protein CH330_05380 [candidate division WOR-3 bacterium JGI_Cruoil_03_51_56]OYD16240.1 MAG: hypothetical protein CH330_03380 [candidate division WOR-3 bacterium JGI_Cruoil_03_51_56]
MAIDVLTNGVCFITLFVPELPELEIIKDKLRLMLIGRRDRTFLRVHNRLGQACPVCGTEIQRKSYKDSTTYYCPGCQTHGKTLADRWMSRLLK